MLQSLSRPPPTLEELGLCGSVIESFLSTGPSTRRKQQNVSGKAEDDKDLARVGSPGQQANIWGVSHFCHRNPCSFVGCREGEVGQDARQV